MIPIINSHHVLNKTCLFPRKHTYPHRKLLEDDIAKKWNNFSANDGNFDACNAIAMKLNEVARIAENLDRALKDTHKELTDAVEIVSSSSDRKCASDHEVNYSLIKTNKFP